MSSEISHAGKFIARKDRRKEIRVLTAIQLDVQGVKIRACHKGF